MNNNLVFWEKEELIYAIRLEHHNFKKTISALEENQFGFSWNEKWTPGQQLVHIKKSLAPVVMALMLPRFLLKYQFGVANRPSKTYDALVARYLKALNGSTAKAPRQFQPPFISFKSRDRQIKSYEKTVKRLIKVSRKLSEKELDDYILPHPLIGKITLREMLFFCIYHVQHHHSITKQIIEHCE